MKPVKIASWLFGTACLTAAAGAAYVYYKVDMRDLPVIGREQTAALPSGNQPSDLQHRIPSTSSPLRPAPSATESAAPEQTAMLSRPTKPAFPMPRASVAQLQQGLSALAGKRIDEARIARDALPAKSLDRHILAWAIALNGGSAIPASEIAWTLQNLPNWPANAVLRRNGERAAWREQAGADVVRAISGEEPLTLEGAVILARAHLAKGDTAAAKAVLAPLWRSTTSEITNDAAVATEFATVLTREDHRARMEAMFYAERSDAGLRMADLAGAKDLARAWTAVLKRTKDAGKLVNAVPAAQRDASHIFLQARLARQGNRPEEAAAHLLKGPSDKADMVDPDAWWTEKRLVARRLLDDKPALAYKLSVGNTAASPANAAEAEFHAGWIALRFLKKPKDAAGHFAQIAKIGESPITLSRAYYWMGRAADATKDGKAQAHYVKAASYGTTFYGQLAAAKVGNGTLVLKEPVPSPDDVNEFASREAVAAIDRLNQAGYPQYAARLYTDLAQQITSPGELSLLASKASTANNHFLALRIGKLGMQRGVDVGALSHPIGAIPDTAQIDGAGKALAYAIARQESEFNVGAVSHAGARGLLQLMPATAKNVSQKIGLPFEEAKLTTDPAYNATLGAEELKRQLQRYGGSYVLTFIAYNAGPGRADQWIKRYGDPRGKSVEEVVDWIERVPFSETRSYIQRVLENYEVYKMRISGNADIEADLTSGRVVAQSESTSGG